MGSRGRAPGPQAAKLSLCTPEKLVSPDVLAIPSRYHTAFPAVPWVLYRWYLHKEPYSPSNYRTSQLGPPRSSRSGAKPSCNSPRRLSKSEVTIDCYSEKRSRPSQWSGCALTGTRAWGASSGSTRHKTKTACTHAIDRFFSGRKLGLYQQSLQTISTIDHGTLNF